MQSSSFALPSVWGQQFNVLAPNTVMAPTTLDSKDLYTCSLCKKDFRTVQALGVHRFRTHGVVKPMRLLVEDTHCVVCLLQFWNRTCLVAHLSCSKGARDCAPIVAAQLPPLSAQRVAELDEEERIRVHLLKKGGRLRHTTTAPAIRLSGPLTREAHQVLHERRTQANSRRTGRPKGTVKAHKAA